MDPYAYMSWYYWWYYNNYAASCYWPNSYGYEYPPTPPPIPPPPPPMGDWGENGCNFYPPPSPDIFSHAYQRPFTPGPRSRPSSRLAVPENGMRSQSLVENEVPKINIQTNAGRVNRAHSYDDSGDRSHKIKCDDDATSISNTTFVNEGSHNDNFYCSPRAQNELQNDSNAVENGNKFDAMREDDTDFDMEDWTETIASTRHEEEQSVIESETGMNEGQGSADFTTEQQMEESNKEENGDRIEDEEESSATSTITLTLTNGTCSLVGVVEEPETPSSEDSDTFVEDFHSHNNISIEEYFSESLDACKGENGKNKLSTIDEMTERSRSRLSSLPDDSVTLVSEHLEELDEEKDNEEEEESDEEKESADEEEESSDEEEDAESISETEPSSSVSVIENKSEQQIGESQHDGTNEDEMSSSSSESSSSDEDEDNENAAVTVRLPLRLSFGKTKSSKDITTLLVGTSEMKEEPLEETRSHGYSNQSKHSLQKQINFEVSETNEGVTDEESDEPVVSFTISLSRQNSKNEEEKSPKPEVEEVVDFWSLINEDKDTTNKKEESELSLLHVESKNKKIMSSRSREFTSIDDLWADKEDMDAVVQEFQTTCNYKMDSTNTARHEDYNFWEKRSNSVELDLNDKSRLSSGFEISENYESDSGCNIRGKVGYLRKKKRSAHLRKRHSVCSGTNALPPLPQFKRSSIVTDHDDEETLAHYPTPVPFPHSSNNNNGEPKTCVATTTTTSFTFATSGCEGNEVESSQTTLTTAGIDEQSRQFGSTTSESPSYNSEGNNNSANVTSYKFQVINLPGEETALPTFNVDETINSTSSTKDEITTQHQVSNSTTTAAVEEGSDESSKDSSNASTTVGQDHEDESKKNCEERREARHVEIQALPEKIKLAGNEQEETCTCKERMSRAENLLWRIERFLHESLSLGSEDDSGVMTDISRQISDVDTDADDTTEFLLSTAAAAAAVHKRYAPTVAKEIRPEISSNAPPKNSNGANSCSDTTTSNNVVIRRRPQSDIFVETVVKAEMMNMASSIDVETVTEGDVKMRNTSAERKALRYQRAKTHSRLFQLLQTEKTGQDEEDIISDIVLVEQKEYPGNATVNNNTAESEINCTASSDQQIMRSRLTPLPIKNVLQSSTSCDSTSSPSGSSGVLSPTSPVTRDRLLADIINEFHMRHQSQQNTLSVRRRAKKNFPSKIFKLLQNEFGEEFYQTFDCAGNELFANTIGSTTRCSSSSNGDAGDSAKECVIHKSESLERMEQESEKQQQAASGADYFSRTTPSPNIEKIMGEQRKCDADSRKVGTTDTEWMHVPIRLRKKAVLGRDPRIPKAMVP